MRPEIPNWTPLVTRSIRTDQEVIPNVGPLVVGDVEMLNSPDRRGVIEFACCWFPTVMNHDPLRNVKLFVTLDGPGPPFLACDDGRF